MEQNEARQEDKGRENSEAVKTQERLGLHDLRQGMAGAHGTRHDKQEASGHRSAGMMYVYDKSLPLVSTSEKPSIAL